MLVSNIRGRACNICCRRIFDNSFVVVTICCCIARYPGRPIAVAWPPDRGCNQGTVEEWKEELVTSPHRVHVRPHRNPPRVGFGVRPGRCARGGRTGNLDFKTDCSLSEV